MSVLTGVEQEIPRDHKLAELLAGLTAQLRSGQQPDLNALMARLDNVASGVENLTKSFTGEKIDNLLTVKKS